MLYVVIITVTLLQGINLVAGQTTKRSFNWTLEGNDNESCPIDSIKANCTGCNDTMTEQLRNNMTDLFYKIKRIRDRMVAVELARNANKDEDESIQEQTELLYKECIEKDDSFSPEIKKKIKDRLWKMRDRVDPEEKRKIKERLEELRRGNLKY